MQLRDERVDHHQADQHDEHAQGPQPGTRGVRLIAGPCGLGGGGGVSASRRSPVRSRLAQSKRVSWQTSRRSALGEVEHELKRVVDAPHLVARQMPDLVSERSGINRADHLAHHTRRLSADRYLRMKARRCRRGRCWTDDDCRKHEQIVRLHDHREAASSLGMATPARQLDCMNVTANHEAVPSALRPRGPRARTPDPSQAPRPPPPARHAGAPARRFLRWLAAPPRRGSPLGAARSHLARTFRPDPSVLERGGAAVINGSVAHYALRSQASSRAGACSIAR